MHGNVKSNVGDIEGVENTMADKGLTIKQEKYAQGLFAGLSQREAYKEAFNCAKMTDKTVDEAASRLANDSKVIARLDELTNELKERNMVTAEKVIAEMAHIAFDDIKNYLRFYPDEQGNIRMQVKDSDLIDTRAVSEVSVGKDGQFRFKLYCKDNALQQLAKILGIVTDKVDIKGEINNNNVNFGSEEERRLYLESIAVDLERRKK